MMGSQTSRIDSRLFIKHGWLRKCKWLKMHPCPSKMDLTSAQWHTFEGENERRQLVFGGPWQV